MEENKELDLQTVIAEFNKSLAEALAALAETQQLLEELDSLEDNQA